MCVRHVYMRMHIIGPITGAAEEERKRWAQGPGALGCVGAMELLAKGLSPSSASSQGQLLSPTAVAALCMCMLTLPQGRSCIVHVHVSSALGHSFMCIFHVHISSALGRSCMCIVHVHISSALGHSFMSMLHCISNDLNTSGAERRWIHTHTTRYFPHRSHGGG